MFNPKIQHERQTVNPAEARYDPLAIRTDGAPEVLQERFVPKNPSVQAQISTSNPKRYHSPLPNPLPTGNSQKQLTLTT